MGPGTPQAVPTRSPDGVRYRSVLFKHFLQKPRARPFYPHLERLTFVQADATKAFPFENGTFDFTHSRIPDTFLSEENWPQLVREMTRVTQSGGWVEIVAAGHMETEHPSEIIDALLHAEIQMCQAINLAPAGAPGLPVFGAAKAPVLQAWG